jgi:uncharacterized protein (DUF697 family)
MKCKSCKIWLPIIAILIAGFYVAYRFVPVSPLGELHLASGDKAGDPSKETSSTKGLAPQRPDDKATKPDNKTPQKKMGEVPAIQHLEIPFQPVVENYLLQGTAWLKKVLPLELVTRLEQFKVIFIPLLILVILLLVMWGRGAFYQRRIRSKTYRGYKALYQAGYPLHTDDLVVIDQDIVRLTKLYGELTKNVSVPLSHTPALYSLCTQVDYTLNRLQEKRLMLVGDPVKLAKSLTQPVGVESEMTIEQRYLMAIEIADRVIAKLQQRPAPSTRSISKFAGVIAWKKQRHNEKSVEEPEPLQALAESLEHSPLLETVEDNHQITQPEQQPSLTAVPENSPLPETTEREDEAVKSEAPLNVFARSASKFSNITFWKKKTQADTPTEQQPQPVATEPKPTTLTGVDDIVLAKTEQQSNVLSQSISKFATIPFWKKKKQDGKPSEAQEASQSIVTPEPEPLLQATQAPEDIKHRQAQSIIQKHILAGMALSAVPIPMLDVAALTSTQLNLLHSLSVHYGVEFDKDKSKSIVIALLGGSLPTTAIMWLSSLTKMIPGIGTLGGGASLSATAGAVIYATGQAFIKHFEAGGELQDFDGKQQREFFQQALKESLANKTKKTVAQPS